MKFNLNEFLMAVSFALDFVEMDILGMTSNHGKRTAYISVMIAKKLSLSLEEVYDVASFAMLHDNGLSEYTLHNKLQKKELKNMDLLEAMKEHCIIGERNIKDYPLLTKNKNIIKYHHERYDGSGFFNLKGNEIPLMSQIIAFSDYIEKMLNSKNKNYMCIDIFSKLKEQENVGFSSNIISTFEDIVKHKEFWIDLKDDAINDALKKEIPEYGIDLSFEEIRNITNVFSKIIDSKSQYTQKHSQGLAEKVIIMADFYNMEKDEKIKLKIAADLHDLGKLAVPNKILDSPKGLSKEEFDIIKKHTYFTRLALQEIKGFEDITEWASNHHEKLNGKGYPFGKKAEELDFNSRLMGCLDIYQALTEDRPYRLGLSHKETMNILNSMVGGGFIDKLITNDINQVFA